MTVVGMKAENFKNFPAGQSQLKLKSKTRPYLHDIAEVQFQRGSRNLFYKSNHSDCQLKEFDFLKKNFQPETSLSALPIRPGPRGIPQRKNDDIVQKLCPLMPQTRKIFWESFTVNDDLKDLMDD
ncbi:hypothetical protein JTE90_001855 [Oedothorax gibbosus]|uniref:Uncharacterized protein n=1 Tax=Oedothorax gibbosus TaxID=931172 RepID=A0AAV6VMT4_9ARAC|nr:hypothetical protein JTE90_001855 [Oedothorax gibbosus]